MPLPARRMTVPADHIAVIMDQQLASEVMSLLMTLRTNPRKLVNDEAAKAVAGDLTLRMCEASFSQHAPLSGA